MNTTTLPQPIHTVREQLLCAEVYQNRSEMGRAAAISVATRLRTLASNQPEVRVVFACAPSQNEFLEHLTGPGLAEAVPWSQIVVFHMDDYVGMTADDSNSFRAYLREHLLNKVEVRAFHPLQGEAEDIDAECRRYEDLLLEKPIDLICLGIGENGHLAFNDPPVADFDDPHWVKVVELDPACRRQQVNDGCFADIDKVPTHALTLTLPVFRAAKALSCVVPGPTKAEAVAKTLVAPVTTRCPSTMLLKHPDARLYLDKDSARLI